MNILLFASLLVAISAAPSEDSYEDRAAYINGTASAFEKIIKSDDVRTQEPIHLTPAVVLIGKRNGQILRCLQEDPNECETFYYATDLPVYSLLIVGEYFYAGLGSGTILRCELSMKGSCSTFHTCSRHDVVSLEVVGGYLHAGLAGNSTVMRCELDQVNSCRLLHTMEDQVSALISSEDHIYAGTWNGKLMRCSLRTENTCTLIYTLDSGIMGLANIGSSLIAVTRNGYMWNCTQKSGSNTDYCVQTGNLEKSEMWDIAAYKGVLYVVNEKGIYICNSANGTDCLNYGRHIGALSIAFSYSTYHMQSRYRGEHATCTWQNHHRCPPFITYYEPQQRSMLEVHVKDGKLRNSVGNLVDTSSNDGHSGAAIFAMGPDGRLLLSNVHVPQLVHTSSLFAGSPVAGAGEMVVENGVIKKMTTCSDHYRPDLALNRQVIESLRGKGYTVAINSQECCEDEKCDHSSPNNIVIE